MPNIYIKCIYNIYDLKPISSIAPYRHFKKILFRHLRCENFKKLFESTFKISCVILYS